MILLDRRHEVADLLVRRHAADAVIAARHNAEQLAVRAAVLRDGNRGVTRFGLELQNVSQRLVRRDVRITHHEPGLVSLCARHHGGLGLHALGTVNERNAALLGKGHSHLIVGNGLHDSRNHGDVHADGRLLPLAELRQGRLQAHVRRDTLRRGIPRDQQVFVKGMTGFAVEISHSDYPPF